MIAFPRILSFVAGLSLVVALNSAVLAQEAEKSLDPQVKEAYDLGVKALEEEKWDDAIAAFSKATSIDPYFAEGHIGRAEALRHQEDYTGAITAYNMARDINPNIPQIYVGRGISYEETGVIDLAINDFQNALEKDRNNAEAAAHLGELLVTRAQDATSGLRILDKAIELDPKNADSYRNRGLAHAQLRHWDEAEADLNKAVELDPENFENYAMQANVYLFQDKDEKLPLAVKALGKAIETYKPEESTDPKIYVQGYMLRGDANLKMANDTKRTQEERDQLFDKVVADSEAILDEVPDTYPTSGQALYRKGVAERMQGKYGKAITALTDAILLLPAGESGGYAGQAYLKRGMCWFNQGENRLARGDLEQAASMDYSDPLPHLWLGYTFAAEKDFRSAIDAFGEAIAKNPNSSLPYINRGLSYVQLGELQRAAENFAEAVRVEPDNPDNHVKRGRVNLMMEDYQRAFNAFDLALQRDPENIAALEGAAAALRGLGRSSAAQTYEQRAEDLKGSRVGSAAK
jgi:tetratricopeptide (TPR) repeat protein